MGICTANAAMLGWVGVGEADGGRRRACSESADDLCMHLFGLAQRDQAELCRPHTRTSARVFDKLKAGRAVPCPPSEKLRP